MAKKTKKRGEKEQFSSGIDYPLEFRRAVFHLCAGLVVVILTVLFTKETVIPLLGTIIVIGVILSLLCRRYKLPVIETFLTYFERKEHRKIHPGRGPLLLVVGCFIALFFFEHNIALASIMVLAIGDSFTNIFGPFGKMKTRLHKKKFLEGTITGIIGATLGAMLFIPFWIAFVATLIAMFVELADLSKYYLDDNILIPVIAGLIMTLLLAI
jgi:dolichol kinase